MARKKASYAKVQNYFGKKGGMTTVASGAAMGAMIGAALGAAGMYAFSDSNRRKMFAQRVYSMKDYATEAVEGLRQTEPMNMVKQTSRGRKNGKSQKKAVSKK